MNATLKPVLLAAMIVACFSATALRSEPNEAKQAGDAAYEALLKVGKVTSKDLNPQHCRIVMTMEFDPFVSNLDIFRNAWLNHDYSIDFYAQRRKQVFAFSIAKRFGELVTEGLYHDTPGTPSCTFDIFADYSDVRGQSRSIKLLSYKFDEHAYSAVNWEKFDPRNFQDIALDFKIGPDVRQWISDEPSFSANSSSNSGSQDRKSAACDVLLFNANAAFIRATSFCKKDYMDSLAGHKALAGARECMADMDEETAKDKAGRAMLVLDGIAKKQGKKKVCQFVDELERQVISR